MKRTLSKELPKNSTHRITITDMTSEGQGVGMVGDIPIVADRAIPGERVDVKIISWLKTFRLAG